MLRLLIAALAWIAWLQMTLQHLETMRSLALQANGLAYAGGLVLLILGETLSALFGVFSFGRDGLWIGPLLGIVTSLLLQSWFQSMGWF